MSSTIETTIKALVEFESELDKAKVEASDAKKRLMKDAADWAESAKASAISKAQKSAAEAIDAARGEAEGEAETIRKNGQASLKSFEASISRKKGKATEWVVGRLLGESQ